VNAPRAPIPDWRLPAGVDRALWDYAQNERLAAEEDAYFADDRLCALDLPQVTQRFTTPGRLVDLGCGAGRAALAFARRGFEVVAVDLSHHMLSRVQSAARAEQLPVYPVVANLCDLRGIADAAFDYGLLLFSTLGMIRGREARRKALQEAARVIRPAGRLALHAHAALANRHDPQGRRWLLGDTLRYLADRRDAGDRPMTYRGIPNLVVHQYRWRELARDLHVSGWQVEECVAIDVRHDAATPNAGWWARLRASGWLVLAARRE
jgi:SAM-dependent methyltransferase